MHQTHRDQSGFRTRRGAFTLVELLVAIAIIALLIGIVVAGLFGAQSYAKRAAVTSQLQTIAQAIDAFHNDLGFYPPLVSSLNAGTDAIETPETVAAAAPKANRSSALRNEYRNARYMSEWTLAAFLVGQGDLNGDRDVVTGLSNDAKEKKLSLDDGKFGTGIRNPGESHAWKAPDGSHMPQTTGRDYGPYLEQGLITKFIRRVPVKYDTAMKRIVRDTSGSNPQYLYQFVDAFESPVRFYSGWVTRDDTDTPTVLRLPIELRTAAGVENQLDTDKAPVEAERNLMTAPYALLSAGERGDRYFEPDAKGNAINFAFGDVIIDEARAPQFMQADGNGAFNGDSTDLDLGSFNSGDAERSKSLLKFLKSNVRYLP